MSDLLRPIIGIENRTAQEVFDIMCDRISSRLRSTPAGVTVGEDMVERAARALAGHLFEHVLEGDAESEWGRLADVARLALTAALSLPNPDPRGSQNDLSATGEGEAEPVAWLQPMSTKPRGNDVYEPADVYVHEGSWAVVFGTNGKPIGWLDTHAMFAHRIYRDQILPAPTTKSPEASGEVERALRDEIERLTKERDRALEAEDEAKDCFWAVYPHYLESGGEPISTEAARTTLAERADALQAKLDEARAVLEPFADAVLMLDEIHSDDYAPDWSPFIVAGAYRRARTFLSTLTEHIDGDVSKSAEKSNTSEAGPAVRVKPLEWHRSEIIGWNGDWHTVPTAYSIRCADENGWRWSGFGGFGYERSDEAAKAAAQVDYERRILSALSPTSTSGGGNG